MILNKYHKDFDKYLFICHYCGCNKFYRHKTMYKLNFYEGHVHCIKCKNEIEYHDESWHKLNQQTTNIPNQLTLF